MNGSWVPFKSKGFYLLERTVTVSGNSKFPPVWYQVETPSVKKAKAGAKHLF
jgi:hypothetical protein